MRNKALFGIILVLIVSVFSFKGVISEDIRFHQVDFTASSIHLVEFNIDDHSKIPHVKETIDEFGRTTELRFYNSNHKLSYAGSGFYGGPIVKYDYLENSIVETFYTNDNEIASDFRDSEVPYRFIYHLNEDREIVLVEDMYKIDFQWDNESLDVVIEHLKEYKKYDNTSSELKSVFGFQYAFAKMNGVNPQKVN